MSKKENTSKSKNNLKELFGDSDAEFDSTDIKTDSIINYIKNFEKWTIHHYYAMKYREVYPNMFFYYFPNSLFQLSKIKEEDKSKVIDYILKTDEKQMNGRWGYLPLILENTNISGEQLYNSISNNRAIINFSNSFPLKEDAKPDFDKSIEKKVWEILNKKKNLYNEVLSEFEFNLKNTDISKWKKYTNFIKNHETSYIYCDQSKNMNKFLSGLLELNEEGNNINNNIILLPENYKEIQKNNKDKENKDENVINSEENNTSKKKVKSKRKLVKNKKLYKFDFDLDSFDDISNVSNDELSLSSEYKVDKINSKSKKIISDEDNNEFFHNLNNNGKLDEIPLDLSRDSKSKKNKKSKNSKKDISYKSEIIYLNNNKENQIKNNFDNIQNSGFKSSLKTMKNPNINYSTNLSSNFNLLDSKSNIENIIQNNKTEIKENNNKKDDFIIEIKNKPDNINDNADIEFYQNEQQINGYASDFTKKIYYPKQIKNKILVFSDNEENNYLKKNDLRKKQKITRIKANENVIIREKRNIKNYDDFAVIGIESGYIDKNIEKLKRGLMHKKMEIRKRKNKNKINMKIKQLKKQFKEEDFNNFKIERNYNKFIRNLKNLEKNKKYKIEKTEEKKVNNNIRSKKGNYYEIASKKNFNIDLNIDEKNNINNDINMKENKNERRFFNCFINREKEDLNFSDTDSFLSLFNNPKNDGYKRRNKNTNNNRKLKLKEYYDNSRNQNINTFFPKISKDNFIKDRQIVISIRKLIDNEKYQELFNFIMKDINLDSKIPQYISDICSKIFKYSNEIDFEKLNRFQTINGFEIKINNSDNLNYQENKILINNEFDVGKMDVLFKAYLEKLQISLSFLLAESKYNNNIGLNYKKEELNNFMELNVVENLLKLIIININKTQSINFSEFMLNNIGKNDLSTNEYVKNELDKYLCKIKTIFNESFIKIISDIFITFIRFFISYKPKEVKLMDVQDFCFMSYTFLQIMQALFQKIKELEEINKKFNINIPYIPNTGNIREITNKYIKCLCLFLLNHLFIYSPSDFIPLIIKKLKKEATFGQSSSPPESLIIVALFKSISSLYVELNSENNINNGVKTEDNSSFIMIDKLFSEYLNNEIEIDTSNLGSLNELLIKELRDYISSNLNNCLSKEKRKLSIIGNIKKVFLYNCFEIDNLRENEHCIKTMMQKKIIINLIQRYLFVLISYFIYYGKNIDCLEFFNEFYKKYNNAIDNNNMNNSYFNAEIIKEIIDKNMKLNLNKLVKGYLVEEYIYSDVQLMNFYGQFWQISFDNKRIFIKNYFEIMCNHKYKSRKIDNIFKKEEIHTLINRIFEFKDQQNILNKSNDISQDENENENSRDNIINSFDSILIKTIYMISESINQALISLDSNNNESEIKKNLSKIISISNLFMNNISQLNSDNYTLFIIPMISTILIFTQHLLKFKERINIENTMNKIKKILNFESSGLMLKSFCLSLWINIIQKISEKNSNIEIGKYIEMINTIIHQIVEEYHKPQQRGFSMQMFINPNYDSWNAKKEQEYFEIINDYLMNIKNFADKNPILLIKYYSILDEMHDILNIKFYYPPKMRIQLIEIINSLINHINRGDQQINEQLSKLSNNNNENMDEDEIMFDALNGNIINSLFNESDDNSNFYNFLNNKIVPNIKHILDIFISTENTNVMNKKKILYPLYEANALLYANIFGLLIKYGINQDNLKYPSYVFNLYYNKENDKSNLFDSVFKSIYSNKNYIEKECYIKLPFKLLDIYLNYYRNFIGEIINDNNFNLIIKYYLELFFIGIFVCNKKNKNNFMNYEIKFCEKIFKNIKANKDLLNFEKEKIKNELNVKNFISDDLKNKICLLNIMIILADINNDENKIGTNKFNEIVFGELLAKLSLNFNIEQIDSEMFFEIINGQKTKIALNQINKLSNFSNGYNNSQKFNENEINVKLYILSKYQDRYIQSQLNNKFTSYIDDFINDLTGEKILSSIVTLKFINSLLSQEKNFSKKFETCLKKVYNELMSRSSDICNILSLKDREGNLRQVFSNIEVNELISTYNKRYPNNNILKKNIYNLDTDFLLKDNIKSKFIEEKPLDISISSNFYPNLLKYILNSRNAYSYEQSANKYYKEAIYYYVSICNIINKENKIYDIAKGITKLYDIIESINGYNVNYVYDLKSFYVFLFILEKINSFISCVIRIEDLENYSNNSTMFLSEDKLLSHDFIMKTINVIDCVCSFMYQYIILVLKGHSINNKYVHSFIIKKTKSYFKKNSCYFTNNTNLDDINNFMNEYLKEKYGESMIYKGYKIVEKITNNIKIYTKNDEEINKRIDFIKYINFDGIQYFINDSAYKSKK